MSVNSVGMVQTLQILSPTGEREQVRREPDKASESTERTQEPSERRPAPGPGKGTRVDISA